MPNSSKLNRIKIWFMGWCIKSTKPINEIESTIGLANWCVPLSIIIQVTSQIIYDKLSPFLKHNDMLLKHNVISFTTPLQINIAFSLNITSNNLVHIIEITHEDLQYVSLSSTLSESPLAWQRNIWQIPVWFYLHHGKKV